MWVHLVDADSKIPNLALMKLSNFFKSRGAFVTMSKGDTLTFSDRLPDKIYISIIFKNNSHLFDEYKSLYPDTIFDIGGSGYDLKKVLPPEIENMKPDFSLYPDCGYSLGYSSRGCIRNCYFCNVKQKEGDFRRTQHPSEWYDPKYTKIMFLDSNILCDKAYFFELTDWCMEKGLEINFQSGYDIRLMDLEIAKRLYEMKKFKMLSFAWDNVKDEKHVLATIKLLKQAGFTKSDLRSMVQFYVYVDSDMEFDSGLYRCLKLRELGVNAFVMFNIDNTLTDRVHKLQRWADRRSAYWSESPESKKLLTELRLMGDKASQILLGDCAETLKTITDESVDLIVTDPPYGYNFMGLEWDKALPSLEALKECLRVLKPGAFAFFMCAPRQDVLSRMIVRLSEAGFETGFSSIYWCYSTGFSKSADTSKLIDKRYGVEREVISVDIKKLPATNCYGDYGDNYEVKRTIPSTPEAKQFDGAYNGFQPKPAFEVILVCMRPLSEKTYVDQALKNGKGITWLDDCRIPYASDNDIPNNTVLYSDNVKFHENRLGRPWSDGRVANGLPTQVYNPNENGRFPANLLVCDDALDNGIINHGNNKPSARVAGAGALGQNKGWNTQNNKPTVHVTVNDSGSYSRFFDLDAWFKARLPETAQRTYPALIVPKPSKSEKNRYFENNHQTVKPLKLMAYLITMGSREYDVVLDPFCGSGTTGEACRMLKRRFIGCELDEKWRPVIEARAYMRGFDKNKYNTYDDFEEEDEVISGVEETLSEGSITSEKMAI